ncbi:MAG: hypothetical protein KGI50_05845 [Patescibacteria group bacterium]|nr:hypothetical protein [Patescibacteria group bacterium]MDE2438799.1 hypothetical protein [Patescibacteria group bacterium]
MMFERLTQLADHLDNIPFEEWDFTTPINACGTAGCALYQFPKLWPEECAYSRFSGRLFIKCKTGYPEFLGIGGVAFNLLFMSGYAYGKTMCDVTPKIVATKIREFMKFGSDAICP